MKRKTKRIFSLLLSLAVMATMLTALPLTASAAEGDAYYEWFVYGSSAISTTSPYNSTKTEGTLAATPTYSSTGTKYSSTDVTPASAFTLQAYSGSTTIAASKVKALKMEGTTNVRIDTKFSKNTEYESYDLLIAYNARYDSACGLNIYKEDGSTLLGTTSKTGANLTESYEIKDLTDDIINIKRTGSESRLLYVGIKYNYPSTEPEISIDGTLALTKQETATLTPVTENMEESEAIFTWSSDATEVATVDSTTGLITAVAAGTANIKVTAEYSGGSYESNSCVVTVTDKKPVSVTKTDGIKSIKVTDVSNAENTGTIKYIRSKAVDSLALDYGTYNVEIECADSFTLNDGNTTMLTVAPNQSAEITAQASIDYSVKDTDYSKLSNEVVWDITTQSGSDIEYIQLENKNPVYVKATSADGVYMVVDTLDKVLPGETSSSRGKFNPWACSNNSQFNKGTVLTLPVIEGSTITINSTKAPCVNQEGSLVEMETVTSGEYKYTNNDASASTVDIYSQDGYITKVTVTPPTYTGIVLPDAMTLDNGNHSPATITVSGVTEAYTGEYADVFGDLTKYTKEVGYLNSAGRSASTDYTLVQDGVYKIYALVNYGKYTNTFVLKKGEETILDNVSPAASEILAVENNGQDVYVYSYVTGNLTAGTYNLSFTSVESGASDLMALVMVPYDKLLGGETDSGKYTSADAQTKGVIRFLQGYTGVDVSGYGLYFVDGAGEIVQYEGADYKLESTEPMTGGFYGDLNGIDENDSNTYYAKPFVDIGGTVLYGDAIGGTVNWDMNLDYTESEVTE